MNQDYCCLACFCCTTSRQTFVRRYTKFMILTDVIYVFQFLYFWGLWLGVYFNFTSTNKWQKYMDNTSIPKEVFLQVIGSIIMVTLPLNLMLLIKLRQGIYWYKDQRRPTFKGYYYASLVFYLAYFVLMSLVIATSTKNLSSNYIFQQVDAIIGCIPSIWFLVYAQSYNDKFSFTKSTKAIETKPRLSINTNNNQTPLY